jgi:uroporphyrin-III C-methyltransferase
VLVAIDVSLSSERLVRGRLSALPFLVETVSEDSPTLLMIGEATRAKREFGPKLAPSALTPSLC